MHLVRQVYKEQREQLSSRSIITYERHRESEPYRLTCDVLRINQSGKDIVQLARARVQLARRRRLARCVTIDTSLRLGLYYLTRLYLTVCISLYSYMLTSL